MLGVDAESLDPLVTTNAFSRSMMKAMFDTIAAELRTEEPITSWRRTYETTEARIVGVLEAMGDRYPGVLVGSYPKFHVDGAIVGNVTGSWYSPLLGKALLLGWQKHKPWVDVVEIDGRPAHVTPTPFYDPKGSRARA